MSLYDVAELKIVEVIDTDNVSLALNLYICHGFVSAGDALGRERPVTPDVDLLCWALWVQGDLILIYCWGGLHSAVPTGGGPCSAVLRHLRVVNTLVRE